MTPCYNIKNKCTVVSNTTHINNGDFYDGTWNILYRFGFSIFFMSKLRIVKKELIWK